MKPLKEIKDIAEKLYNKKGEIENQARELVREILKEKKEIFITGNGGYAMVETMDGWIEDNIIAIRIKEDNTLELTTVLDCDDDGNDIANWEDENEVFTEYDHYSKVNWVSVLMAIESSLSNQ